MKRILFLNGLLDLNQLENYANQNIPNYINEDNTPNNNPINDAEATLGRVLFYDKNLSVNNTVSCASCHQQQFAFGDPATQSVGLNGELTGRHSMRLINARFADEDNFFWDERANSLEDQTTQPIQDHVEMGFSGIDGDPGLDSLFRKMQDLRSIQSFDSRYDVGRASVGNNNQAFPNFTNSENRGKALFMNNQNQGGANCDNCHNPPEFDIAPNRRNNGVIGVAGDPNAQDLTNTRSPTLRDLVNPNGTLNGPMMHDGSLTSLRQVIDHYNAIPQNNPNLDNRLRDGNQPQRLNLSEQDKLDLEAFLRTLTGNDVYTNPIWSDPFDAAGNLQLILPCTSVTVQQSIEICEGETFEGFSVSGNYTLNLVNAAGCDSIVNLALAVIPSVTDLEYTICEDESVTIEGITLNQNNTNETFVYESLLGCDSIVNIQLTVDQNCNEENNENEIALFEDFPFLNSHINVNNCQNTVVEVYNYFTYQFLYVLNDEGGALYLQDGTFYCRDGGNRNCVLIYSLNNPVENWFCNDEIEGEEPIEPETETEPETPVESSSEIFNDYPFLADLIDANDCADNSVVFYQYGAYTFLKVENEAGAGARLYFQDGTFYCADGTDYDCATLYQLGNPVESWTCEDAGTTPDTSPEEPPTDELVIFEDYPFLNDLVNTENCRGISLRIFDLGIYKFIFVGEGRGGRLYFQDGTLYCTNGRNYNCINLYGLGQPTSIWNCDGNNTLNAAKQTDNLVYEKSAKTELSKESFTIYPNPTKGSFYIDLVQKAAQFITIQNLNGVIIWEENIKSGIAQIKVELTDVPSGMYTVSIQNEKTVQTMPLIIH